MGRRATYELDDVYRGAVGLFKTHGFHQVSVNDLLDATGLNRFALYEKFGGKEGLFYDTLDFYHQVIVRDELLGKLYRESASLDAILRMLRALRRINANPGNRPGCLVMNANIELGGQDERVVEAADYVIGTFREAIEHALRRAEERGDLAPVGKPSDLAARAGLMIQGFFSLAYISREAADQFIAQFIREVQGWKAVREPVLAGR